MLSHLILKAVMWCEQGKSSSFKEKQQQKKKNNRQVIYIYQASDKTRTVLRLSEISSKNYTAICDSSNSSTLS